MELVLASATTTTIILTVCVLCATTAVRTALLPDPTPALPATPMCERSQAQELSVCATQALMMIQQHLPARLVITPALPAQPQDQRPVSIVLQPHADS